MGLTYPDGPPSATKINKLILNNMYSSMVVEERKRKAVETRKIIDFSIPTAKSTILNSIANRKLATRYLAPSRLSIQPKHKRQRFQLMSAQSLKQHQNVQKMLPRQQYQCYLLVRSYILTILVDLLMSNLKHQVGTEKLCLRGGYPRIPSFRKFCPF